MNVPWGFIIHLSDVHFCRFEFIFNQDSCWNKWWSPSRSENTGKTHVWFMLYYMLQVSSAKFKFPDSYLEVCYQLISTIKVLSCRQLNKTRVCSKNADNFLDNIYFGPYILCISTANQFISFWENSEIFLNLFYSD